jgi:hypothetical protein
MASETARVFTAILLSLLQVLLVTACSGKRITEAPPWVEQAKKNNSADAMVLSRRMAGRWVLNEELSDDTRDVIDAAFNNSKLFRNKRGSSDRNERGSPSTHGANAMAGHLAFRGGPGGHLDDPRLQALFARELEIVFVNESLVYRYPEPKPGGHAPRGEDAPLPETPPAKPKPETMAYPINGRPVSDDGSINIAFAEWERQQFVIEKNGPRGSIVEIWTPSPDAARLHLSIQIELPLLPEPITVNRLFDSR